MDPAVEPTDAADQNGKTVIEQVLKLNQVRLVMLCRAGALQVHGADAAGP